MAKLKKPIPSPRQNQIIAALPAVVYERLVPHLELIRMPLGWEISEAGDHVRYLHFPVSGVVSLIYGLEDGNTSEIAMVGNEGLIGISIYMGGESMPSSTEVQSAGLAYRLSRSVMKEEFKRGGELQHLSLLYAQTLISQTSQAALCNQHHSLDQQLCRWLLMSIDRLNEDNLLITQSLLAKLLGVSRESVNRTAMVLQKAELITYARGRITVLNRPLLEKRVCECYAVVVSEYRRLLPTVTK